ncbi:hypothetical protein [Chitinophaga polysaccharea]|uniref:hypothetical protein n=1 Tax=Chitinophaga polysaccharea TaxID=1293035 RepID=UPI0011572F74|nr:hypothetical protein [Chitinophaga polysaccharea]
MQKVLFTPVGIAMKQHELYGLDDAQLNIEANHLYTNIVDWSINHFILDDEQINWLYQQDDSFKVEFAMIVGEGLINRYDFNINFVGPDIPKSKRISAKNDPQRKAINILVLKSSVE